uniref:Uncharacterized protein n=1 Tax=Anguilla anguilla TaxID=7936 RepID=A0A0E9TP15_ANGAN
MIIARRSCCKIAPNSADTNQWFSSIRSTQAS